MKWKATSLRKVVKLTIIQPDQIEKKIVKSQATEKRNNKSNIATESADIWSTITD